jgi:hypothetical protein
LSYLISIRGLHTKLWGRKVAGILTLGISGFPFGSPKTKCHLDVGLMERHKVYYKGEGGGFSPKSKLWWVLWVWICSWLVLAPKVLQLCINQLVIWFFAGPCEWLNVCHSSWSHLEALACPFTPKVQRVKERVPNSLLFQCSHFILTFESIKELGSASYYNIEILEINSHVHLTTF